MYNLLFMENNKMYLSVCNDINFSESKYCLRRMFRLILRLLSLNLSRDLPNKIYLSSDIGYAFVVNTGENCCFIDD